MKITNIVLPAARAMAVALMTTAGTAALAQTPKWLEESYAGIPLEIRTAYTNGDWASVLNFTKPLAERGNPHAQTMMGLLFYLGNGVPQDFSEAASWYRRGAEQGNPVAQSNLGDMYYAGQGVSRDYDRALHLWRQAGESGHTIAMANIGLFYVEGIGVEPNKCEAYSWWRKAAALGGGLGQNNISIMLDLGDGVAKDHLQAFIWATLAVKNMEPGQDSQREYAAGHSETLAKRLNAAQLTQAEQLMREQTLEQLVAALPACVP